MRQLWPGVLAPDRLVGRPSRPWSTPLLLRAFQSEWAEVIKLLELFVGLNSTVIKSFIYTKCSPNVIDNR